MPASGVETEVVPVRGRVVKSKWARNLLTFLMVFGPGLIVMVADNDAGAVSTYSQAGAQYGTHLLWIVLLLLPVTYFIQEMVVRLGIATGKGHAAMIYQRFGKWWGLFSLVDLELVNFLTLVTEFAAIDLALTKMGVDPRIGVPLVAAGLVLIAVTGSYRRWERIVVFLCLLDLAWFAIAFRLASAGVADRARLSDSRDAARRADAGPDVPGDRDRRHHGGALAALLPAELHRRQAPALRRREVGAAGHLSGRLHHHHRGRLHDDRRQRVARPRIHLHRSGADGDGHRQLSPAASSRTQFC